MADRPYFIEQQAAGGPRRFACVDRSARFTEPRLSLSRLGAMLAPFQDEAAARAALREACDADARAAAE